MSLKLSQFYFLQRTQKRKPKDIMKLFWEEQNFRCPSFIFCSGRNREHPKVWLIPVSSGVPTSLQGDVELLL